MCVCALWVFPQSGSVLFFSKVMLVTMAATLALNLSLLLSSSFPRLLLALSPNSLFLLFFLPLSFFWLTVSAASITHHSKQATSHHLHGTVGPHPGSLISGREMLCVKIIEMLHILTQCFPASPPNCKYEVGFHISNLHFAVTFPCFVVLKINADE